MAPAAAKSERKFGKVSAVRLARVQTPPPPLWLAAVPAGGKRFFYEKNGVLVVVVVLWVGGLLVSETKHILFFILYIYIYIYVYRKPSNVGMQLRKGGICLWVEGKRAGKGEKLKLRQSVNGYERRVLREQVYKYEKE